MIKDRHITHKIATVFIPAREMIGLLEDPTSKVLTGLGAGVPVFGEMLSTANVAGLAMDQAGDEVNGIWLFPWDMDRLQPFLARVHFFHKSLDTDNPIWKFHWRDFARRSDILSSMPSASGGKETLEIIHGNVAAVSWSYEITPWVRPASTYWADFNNTKIGIAYSVELDSLGGASAQEIYLHGIEIGYAREMCTTDRKDTKTFPLAYS